MSDETQTHRRRVSAEQTRGSTTQGTFERFRVSADAELVVNVDGLVRHLTGSALRSKARKSTLAGGLVVLKIVGPITEGGQQ